MKIRIFVFLALLSFTASSQGFKYPPMPVQGKSVKSLLPAQWKIVDSVSGDLNNDKEPDLVMVLEFYAAVKESRAYGDNETDLITELQKPRILAIYFKAGKNYKLNLQNNNFVLRAEEGGSTGDPLRPMRITGNKLVLNYEGGAGWKWKLNYSFKHNNGTWQLTEAENYAYHSSSGEMSHKKYDFVNRKRTVINGTVNDRNAANKTEQQSLNSGKIRTFATFKKPWTWEIRPGEFL
ncbi:MAG: hypothetical protein EOP00_17595 [Pedobacter sp.]|nr:MAG: hypothetical protein EOP00_17595 [Pedobacter sp.]